MVKLRNLAVVAVALGVALVGNVFAQEQIGEKVALADSKPAVEEANADVAKKEISKVVKHKKAKVVKKAKEDEEVKATEGTAK